MSHRINLTFGQLFAALVLSIALFSVVSADDEGGRIPPPDNPVFSPTPTPTPTPGF